MTSHPATHNRFTTPLLDRLLEDAPGASPTGLSSGISVSSYKESVRRDLEWLLNSRRWVETLSASLVELPSSVAAYGLPDFTSMSTRSLADRASLRHAIAHAIAAFEPRLEAVSVSLVEKGNEAHGELHYQIDALLRMEPAPERITFDTTFQSERSSVVVRGT